MELKSRRRFCFLLKFNIAVNDSASQACHTTFDTSEQEGKMEALTCLCQSRALQSSEMSDPGKAEASDRDGSHSTACPSFGTNQSCVARRSELTTADCADREKFAIPTADGTVLKLKSGCKGKFAAWAVNLSVPSRILWICQPKHTGFENSVFSLYEK